MNTETPQPPQVGGSELNALQLGADLYSDNKMISEKQVDILCDRAYLAGMLAGWNFGIIEDSEGYEQAVECRRKRY